SWAVGFLGWLPATGLMPPVSRHEPQQVAASIAEHALWHCRGECFQVVAPASLESIFRNTVAIRCERGWRRSFWVLASFRLSWRVALNLLLRQSLAKTQKSSPRMATEFLQTLLECCQVARGVELNFLRSLQHAEVRIFAHFLQQGFRYKEFLQQRRASDTADARLRAGQAGIKRHTNRLPVRTQRQRQRAFPGVHRARLGCREQIHVGCLRIVFLGESPRREIRQSDAQAVAKRRPRERQRHN